MEAKPTQFEPQQLEIKREQRWERVLLRVPNLVVGVRFRNSEQHVSAHWNSGKQLLGVTSHSYPLGLPLMEQKRTLLWQLVFDLKLHCTAEKRHLLGQWVYIHFWNGSQRGSDYTPTDSAPYFLYASFEIFLMPPWNFCTKDPCLMLMQLFYFTFQNYASDHKIQWKA